MSIDAGGLAQMTYQSPFNNTIGVSGPGFGSRGKGHHIKRLSVAPPSKISTIDETQQVNTVSTPRTARGHLLAGLRTAPKSATVPSANSSLGLENSRYAPQYNRMPQTTTAANFPSNPVTNPNHSNNYALADHVLAPPALDFQRENTNGVDQNLYDELVATNNYLAQQQRALQQQLFNIQAAAQQFGGLNLNTNLVGNLQQMQSPVATPMSLYNQQFQQGLQPLISPVPGSPGVFAVYNPMTGQSSFIVDNSAQQQQQQQDNFSVPTNSSSSPPPQNAGYQRQSPDSLASANGFRSRSPPKSTPSPQQEVEPLPPPSANAFRRGHKKNASSVNVKPATDLNRAAGARVAGVPPTSVTGTFGPGQGRAGEHPIRQPRGPPLLQELQEKPTSKHEGSKNFATRQRRRAVHDLVRAGRERTGNRQTGSGSATPGSEAEFNFSVSSSDNDDMLVRSATLSSKPSLGSLRAAASGVIGSERKNSRERNSVDSAGGYSAKSLSSDEGNSVGGNMVEVDNTRRKTPLLVLSSAEKRKSVAM